MTDTSTTTEQALPVTPAWYTSPSAAGILLVLFFPAGLFLMWRYQHWSPLVRWVVTGFMAIFVMFIAATPQAPAQTATSQPETVSTTNDVQPNRVTNDASNHLAEVSLSEIDRSYGQSYSSSVYRVYLTTLADRCNATETKIADMSAVITKAVRKKGNNLDNMKFLAYAEGFTKDGLNGMPCSEMFAFAATFMTMDGSAN